MRTLLVGAGQIGRAVARGLEEPPLVPSVPWASPGAAAAALADRTAAFLADRPGEPWAVCWAAGRGIVGTPADVLAHEAVALAAVLDAVGGAPADVRRAGRLAFAGSAGGVHAGDAGLVTERSEPAPTSAYGEHKLRQEGLVAEAAEAAGVPALIARISNVYGPGQDLAKPQGFITHLCRAVLRREPFVLRVPPDTVRDFVHADDVGRRMALWIEAADRPAPGPTCKLVVSGRSTTLQEVIAVVRAVTRVPSRIATAPPDRAGEQPARTRFRTVELLDLDRAVPARPLAVGVHGTWQALLRRAARGGAADAAAATGISP